MTEQTQPTDAEISACILAAKVKCVHPEAVTTIEIARAVLAKWGTPAVAVDPDNAFPLASKIYKRGEEWVLEVSGTINDCHFTCRHTQPGNLQPEDVAGLPTLYTTPQPTQAQAGAVPLTDDEITTAAEDNDNDSAFMAGFATGARFAERHHGIKGADHA